MGSPGSFFPAAVRRRRAVFLAATAITALLLLHGFCCFVSGVPAGRSELPLPTSSIYLSLSSSIALSPITSVIPRNPGRSRLWEFDGGKLDGGGEVAEFFGGSSRRFLRTRPARSPPAPETNVVRIYSVPPSPSPSPSPQSPYASPLPLIG